jgi:hypothetical protein
MYVEHDIYRLLANFLRIASNLERTSGIRTEADLSFRRTSLLGYEYAETVQNFPSGTKRIWASLNEENGRLVAS